MVTLTSLEMSLKMSSTSSKVKVLSSNLKFNRIIILKFAVLPYLNEACEKFIFILKYGHFE